MTKAVLRDVTVEVTNRCQLRCRACAIWKERSRREISASRFIRLTESLLRNYQVRFISVTGGEPFLHPGIGGVLRFLALMRSRGLVTGYGVYTNGACTARIQRLFKSQGRMFNGIEVGVSVDGDEQAHDALRGKGAYRKTMKTLEFLAGECRDSVKLELKFTINRVNYHALGEVYRLARRFGARFSPKIMEYGVAAYYHRSGGPGVQALSSLTALMRSSVRAQVLDILHGGAEGIDRAMAEAVLHLLDSGRKGISACATPKNSLFITSGGDVHPCLYMPPVGCVDLKGGLPDGLDLQRGVMFRSAKKGDCPGCFAYHGFLKPFNLRYLA